MSRRSQKQKKGKQKKRGQKGGGAASRRADPFVIDLRVPHVELTQPVVYMNAQGIRVPDPHAALGLDPDAAPSAEEVRNAFRHCLSAISPEQDPQRARELIEARDFLLDPGQELDRMLGDLRVPDPKHFLPKYVPRAQSASSKPVVGMSSRTRLVALMALYAILEQEIDGGGSGGARDGLLFD